MHCVHWKPAAAVRKRAHQIAGSADPACDARTTRSSCSQVSAKTIMAATATAVEVNQAQSIAMIRNLMRVTFSNVVYTRGIFDPSQFKPMNARKRCHEWLA